MREIPDWLRLLQAWRGRGKRGLTLPFLVGAVALRAGRSQASRADAKTLLRDIGSAILPGWAVEVGWCDDLKFPIFAVVPSTNSGLVFGRDLKQNFKCDDPDELERRLLAGAEVLIHEGNFSLISDEHGKQWAAFTSLDRELIERAFRE
jgi:hypothetical protein